MCLLQGMGVVRGVFGLGCFGWGFVMLCAEFGVLNCGAWILDIV